MTSVGLKVHTTSNELPDDVWVRIIHRLPFHCVLPLMLASKQMHRVCLLDAVWERVWAMVPLKPTMRIPPYVRHVAVVSPHLPMYRVPNSMAYKIDMHAAIPAFPPALLDIQSPCRIEACMLQSLDLSRLPFHSLDVSHNRLHGMWDDIVQMSHLKHLSLSQEITRRGCNVYGLHVAMLTRLTHLQMHSPRFGSDVLCSIPILVNLVSLHVVDVKSPCSCVGTTFFGGMSKLHTLVLRNCKDFVSLCCSSICERTTLRHLDIRGSASYDVAVRIAPLSHLTALHLGHVFMPVDSDEMVAASTHTRQSGLTPHIISTHLKEFTLNVECPSVLDMLRHVLPQSVLTSFRLSSSGEPNLDVSSFPDVVLSAPHITYFAWEQTYCARSEGVWPLRVKVRDSMSTLVSLGTCLVALCLKCMEYKDFMCYVSRMTQLRSLDISSNPRASGLHNVSALTKLTTLCMKDCAYFGVAVHPDTGMLPIGSPFPSVLAGLLFLQHLDVRGCHVDLGALLQDCTEMLHLTTVLMTPPLGTHCIQLLKSHPRWHVM
jgi:hypothetical protein